MNKLGNGSLGDASYQNIKGLGLSVSEKYFFLKFVSMKN